MKSAGAILFLILLLGACHNMEDASPAGKDTFVKFYHAPYSFTSVEVESIPGGYAILGNMIIANNNVRGALIQTDKNGNQLGDIAYFEGCTAKSLQPIIHAGSLSGYVILGDSIKIDPNASKVGNIEVYKTRILLVNTNGNILAEKKYSDNAHDTARVLIDFKGNSLTTNANNEIIVLGNYREDLARPEKTFVAALDENLVEQWYKTYDLIDAGQIDYNYVNARSIHAKAGNLIWASSILKTTGEFSDSYLAIPYVQEASTFKNFSQLGETSSQLFLVRDIKPSASVGYGVVGTRGNTNGTNTNIFFARVDGAGNFINGSEHYYDGVLSAQNESVAFNQSESMDTGEAIADTPDGGFVLAGSTKIGSNSTDIFLIKVRSNGTVSWTKILGGSGDEMVSSILCDEDGNLIISGTNNLEGLSSIFLIKTDSKGELKN